MGFLPFSPELLELRSIVFLSKVIFIVFFNLGHGFELLNHFLVVAAALGSFSILEILLEGLEDFTDPEL